MFVRGRALGRGERANQGEGIKNVNMGTGTRAFYDGAGSVSATRSICCRLVGSIHLVFIFIFVFWRCGGCCVGGDVSFQGKTGIVNIVVMAQQFDIGARDARLN